MTTARPARRGTCRATVLAGLVILAVLAAGCDGSARTTSTRPITGARLVTRTIRAADGFPARPAYLYLPPELREHPDRRLPVLELLHGTPGGPADWLHRGGMLATADAFAAAHHGMAPIIVMPDLNGARHADSECIRTAFGADVESYLSVDVVAYVRAHYRRAVGTERWWIAGLSEGGLCATMLALRHPRTYSAFGDLSGLAHPVVDHATPAQSTSQLFGTDLGAMRQHDPIWLLQRGRFTGLRGWFACGEQDRTVLTAQAELVAAAEQDGLPVHAQTLPGKHSWTVWGQALRELLPWLWGTS